VTQATDQGAMAGPHPAGVSGPGTAWELEPEGRPGPIQRLRLLLHDHPTLGPAAVLLVMYAAFAVASDRFLSSANMSLIVQQVMIVGTLAIGQTIIILTAGIDLSVGAIMVFASIVMAKLSVEMGVPAPAAILAGFVAGALCGTLNGLLITRLRLPPFIVTLGTMSIFFALNIYVSRAATIRGSDMDPLLTFTGETFGVLGTKVTYGSVAMLAMYLVTAYVLAMTRWGKHVYAIGDDPEAARLAGVRVRRMLVSVYAVAGLVYGIAAWFFIGRIGAASPQAGQSANLDSITAVVIGGTSLFGGRGSIWGTLMGALIVGGARNGLTLVGIDSLWQDFTIGVLIIAAVALDQWVRRVGE
jgi:fructose transport system permease protein